MNTKLEDLLKNKFGHSGSCKTAFNGIDAIYDIKEKDEKFILSNGHAAGALYVVLDEHGKGDYKEMASQLGTHPDRKLVVSDGLVYQPIDCSTGSLGQGLPIAVGIALANRNKNVYCMISDGEMSEGSMWEALRVIGEQKLTNLKILVNANGWGAYKKIKVKELFIQMKSFGLIGYIVDDDKEQIIECLKMKHTRPSFVFMLTSVTGLSEHYE